MTMTLRYTKILMFLMVSLFGFVAAAQNVMQMDSDLALVSQVVVGAGAQGVADWQKIDTPWLVALCWSVIPLAKVIAAVLCMIAVKQMWVVREADAQAFQASKQAGIAGCGILLAMLFGVFILISETWFQQWQTELGAAILGAAQRYIITIGVIVFFVNMREGSADSGDEPQV